LLDEAVGRTLDLDGRFAGRKVVPFGVPRSFRGPDEPLATGRAAVTRAVLWSEPISGGPSPFTRLGGVEAWNLRRVRLGPGGPFQTVSRSEAPVVPAMRGRRARVEEAQEGKAPPTAGSLWSGRGLWRGETAGGHADLGCG
jgi:hypothetical protein